MFAAMISPGILMGEFPIGFCGNGTTPTPPATCGNGSNPHGACRTGMIPDEGGICRYGAQLAGP